MEKEALVCSWSLWDCGVIFKDLFPWWWYSVVRIGINISSDDWGGVIVLSAIFTAPGMHSLSLKSGYYSRHAKFNHLGPEEVMLKHRKKARESNLVLPNSKQEVLMVVLFYNCWMIRDKQWIILFMWALFLILMDLWCPQSNANGVQLCLHTFVLLQYYPDNVHWLKAVNMNYFRYMLYMLYCVWQYQSVIAD